MEVVLGMFFLILKNADIQFAEKELTWRVYTMKKALPTTCRVKLINQKKFAKAVLNRNIKGFVVHIKTLGLGMAIYLARKTQMALLLAKKVTVLAKYSDFLNVFLEKLANILLEQTGVNEYAIELEKSKQPPYRPIYSLELVELKILKIYIKANLANGFIRASKTSANTLILFVCKPDGSFCLCVNY